MFHGPSQQFHIKQILFSILFAFIPKELFLLCVQ